MIGTLLRNKLRYAAYKLPVIRRRIGTETPSPESNAAFWDKQLSNTSWSAYLGGTISIDWRNSLIADLIKHHSKSPPKILDMACAGGSLSHALHDFESYHGVDVSEYAVTQAKQANTDKRVIFSASDLRTFPAPANSWDTVVMAEVLYYLSFDNAVAQIKRYAKALRPDGFVVISMKEDGKSDAIFAAAAKSLKWIDGVIYQAKPNGPQFRIMPSRERPAYLIGAFRQR